MPPGTKIFDFAWVADNLDTIAVRIGQHLVLTIIPLLLGIVVAMVLRHRRSAEAADVQPGHRHHGASLHDPVWRHSPSSARSSVYP